MLGLAAGISILQKVFETDGLNFADLDFLYTRTTNDDIALSQACE